MARFIELSNQPSKDWLLQLGDVDTMPALIPGCVFNDVNAAGLIEQPTVGLNSLNCAWIANKTAVYRTKFSTMNNDDERFYIVCQQLVGCGSLYINKCKATTFCNQQLTADITQFVKLDSDQNELEIVFHPSPLTGEYPQWDERAISGKVYLKSTTMLDILNFSPNAIADEGLGGCIECNVEVKAHSAGKYIFRYVVAYDDDSVLNFEFYERIGCVNATFMHPLSMKNVNRWQALKKQPCYVVRLSVERMGLGCDSVTTSVGFRTIKKMATGAWMVNGEQLTIRGASWQAKPIGWTNETIRLALDQLSSISVNLIHIGSDIDETDEFYDELDDRGLLFIKDLPIDDYTKAMKIVERVKGRPSLLSFCGGAVLIAPNQPADERHPAVAKLVELTNQYKVNFEPVAPSGAFATATYDLLGRGVLHHAIGPNHYMMPNEWVAYANADDAAMRTLSLPSLKSTQSIESLHGGLKYWPTDSRYWQYQVGIPLDEVLFQSVFGSAAINQVIRLTRLTRFMQGEYCNYMIKSMRKRGINGTIWSGACERFPMLHSAYLINHEGRLTPAAGSLQNAWARTCAVLELQGLSFKPNDMVKANVFLCDDHKSQSGLVIKINVYDINGSTLYDNQVNGEAFLHKSPMNFSFHLIDVQSAYIIRLDVLDAIGIRVSRSEYVIVASNTEPFAPLLNLPVAKLATSIHKDGVEVSNESSVVALGVCAGEIAGDFCYGALLPKEKLLFASNTQSLQVDGLNTQQGI